MAQIEAVVEDIGADAVKIGMLGSAGIVRAVERAIVRLGLKRIVIDPVMIAKGDRLLQEDAVAALRNLLPHAHVVTPNIPEAEVLTGLRIRTRDEMRRPAAESWRPGPASCSSKGVMPRGLNQ